jgi:hypothetical protein
MNPPSDYATPAAFRSALTERIKERERSSPWSVAQLQRQFAYDRLLARLYLVDDGWIVKGATALLARDLGVRGSLDIDLYREIAQEVAEFDFRRAAELEIDWMRFEIGPARPIGDGDHAVRLPVISRIGTTIWVQFRVDLVGSDLRMTGQPEDVPPLARGVMPDVTQRGIARTRSLTTSRTKSRRPLSGTASSSGHRRDIVTSSILSRSWLAHRWTRNSNRQHCAPSSTVVG